MAKSWKVKYQELKKSRKKGIIGRVTGTVNRVMRSAGPLALNIVSGLSAFAPIVKHAAFIAQNPLNNFAVGVNNLTAEVTGYNGATGTMDWMQPIKYAAGVVVPQVVKKVGRMAGGW